MLAIKNVSKNYDGKKALQNVSLHIPKGVCYGFVGPNGAGKSTLIKMIASVIQDFDGEIQFLNTKWRTGYVPQEIALEETVTARDNLYFFGRLYGLRGKALKSRTEEVLSKIGLKKREKDKVLTFSGGMKRRLNIGCAIMHKPNFILMDEPTVGIDPQSRRYIFQMIEGFKQEGSTIIYASHYMEEIEQLCDQTAFMDHGEIVEYGSLDSLLQKYTSPAIYVQGTEGLPDDLHQYGTITNKGSGYLITTNTSLEVMEQIIHFVKENNRRIDQLELVKPRLEDVFFSLTGSQLRD